MIDIITYCNVGYSMSLPLTIVNTHTDLLLIFYPQHTIIDNQ